MTTLKQGDPGFLDSDHAPTCEALTGFDCTCKPTEPITPQHPWTERLFAVVAAFHHALVLTRTTDYGSHEAEQAHVKAFEVARQVGLPLDESDDPQFYYWALHATQEEILLEALTKILLKR